MGVQPTPMSDWEKMSLQLTGCAVQVVPLTPMTVMGVQLMPTGTSAPRRTPMAPKSFAVVGTLEVEVLSQQEFCAKADEAAARMTKKANFIVEDEMQ